MCRVESLKDRISALVPTNSVYTEQRAAGGRDSERNCCVLPFRDAEFLGETGVGGHQVHRARDADAGVAEGLNGTKPGIPGIV